MSYPFMTIQSVICSHWQSRNTLHDTGGARKDRSPRRRCVFPSTDRYVSGHLQSACIVCGVTACVV